MKRSHAGIAVLALAAALVAVWFFVLREPEGAARSAAAAARTTGKGGQGGDGGELAGGEGEASGDAAGDVRDRDPQGPLRLDGQILDAAGAPIGDAVVMLSTVPPSTTRSQADGSFHFDKLVSRTFTVSGRAGTLVGSTFYKLTSTSDPVVLRLRQGATVAVHVQDEAAHPVAGARIRTDGDDDPRDSTWLATSDAEGRALVTGVPGGWERFIAEAPGYAQGQGMAVVGEPNADPRLSSAEVTIVLRKGVAVSGRVLDGAGKPVAGARVRAEPSRMGMPMWWSRSTSTVSDERGGFRFAAIASGRYVLAAGDGAHARGETKPIEIADQPVNDVVITLPDGGVVAGAVVDREGAEVPFAVVRLAVRIDEQDLESMMMGNQQARQVTSDAHGRFEIQGVARTRLQLRAEGESASSAIAEVSLLEVSRKDDVRLVLDVEGIISGTVVDENGEPLAELGVNVFPDVMGGAGGEGLLLRNMTSTTTDGSGGFVLRGLADVKYRIWASRAGEGGGWGDDVVTAKPGDRNVRLILATPGRISGRLVGSDGKPPAFATVTATDQIPVTTRNGEFTVNEVAPGTYELAVRTPDHAAHTVSNLRVVAGKTTDAGTIELASGRRLTGRVIDAQKRPVAGARVRAGRYLPSFGDEDGMFEGPAEMRIASATTDAGGAFELRGLLPGQELRVEASHASGRSTVLEVAAGAEDPPPVTLQLRGTGSVAGTITIGGKPFPRLQIMVALENEDSRRMGFSGADGSYLVEGVPEGSQIVMVRGNGLTAKELKQRVTVVAGQRAKLDFKIEGGALTLIVPISALRGQQVDAAQIYLFEGTVSVSNGQAMTDRFGQGGLGVEFWFGGAPPPAFKALSPGSYTVCAMPITGQIRDSKLMERIWENLKVLSVQCKPVKLAAAPLEQRLAFELPAMVPLPPPPPSGPSLPVPK